MDIGTGMEDCPVPLPSAVVVDATLALGGNGMAHTYAAACAGAAFALGLIGAGGLAGGGTIGSIAPVGPFCE